MESDDELQNTRVISIIEENFPETIRLIEAQKINEEGSKVNESNNFFSFQKVLLEQKQILWYDLADVRCGSSVASGYTVPRERE